VRGIPCPRPALWPAGYLTTSGRAILEAVPVDAELDQVPAPDRQVSLPAEWTDLAPTDPFVVVAAGRAPFRTADLLKLADEVARPALPGVSRRS